MKTTVPAVIYGPERTRNVPWTDSERAIDACRFCGKHVIVTYQTIPGHPETFTGILRHVSDQKIASVETSLGKAASAKALRIELA